MPDVPRLLDKRQVAQMLTVSRSTVDNLVARGELARPLKIGNSSRWLEKDVIECLERKDWQRRFGPDGSKLAQGDTTEPNDAQTRTKRSLDGK